MSQGFLSIAQMDSRALRKVPPSFQQLYHIGSMEGHEVYVAWHTLGIVPYTQTFAPLS